MNRFFSFILSMVFALGVYAADDAKTILDKAAKNFEAAGNVKIGFRLSTGGQQSMGSIDISGRKYHCNLGGTETWFDGKDMWSLVDANKEVTITTPTQVQASRMNPYSILTMYKNGYACKMGKSTKSYYEVILTGGEKTAYKKVVVRLDKSAYKPMYIKTTGKSELEITVNSFLKNQTFSQGTFTFDKNTHKGIDVNDLR